MKMVAHIIITLIICVPIAIIITLLTFPFWRWFETVTAIESFGHSGPAEWCFVAVYFVAVAIWGGYKAFSFKKNRLEG